MVRLITLALALSSIQCVLSESSLPDKKNKQSAEKKFDFKADIAKKILQALQLAETDYLAAALQAREDRATAWHRYFSLLQLAAYLAVEKKK
jgi:hypothetical protein